MSDSRSIVGRLAPSPTGGLHVGHARTFLVAWLAARAAGGRMVLRIEDIDASRVKPGATRGMIDDLLWLGFDWEEGPDVGGPHGPYLQSERLAVYDAALRRLQEAEAVYPCTCSRADIARAASAPHAGDEGPIYPGTCSGRSVSDALELGDRPFCWRVRASNRPDFRWNDLILGPQRAGADDTGDFIVCRSSGEPSYQLAVVCDDGAMEVNQVIRGDDLVASTPRQLLLGKLLAMPSPQFGHVPLVYGRDGKRLAKRDGSIKLNTLRERGADPRSLIGHIAGSIGLPCVPAEPRGLVSLFELPGVPRSPWFMPSVEDLLQDPRAVARAD
jgi:glutamyl-tRNA synthetase